MGAIRTDVGHERVGATLLTGLCFALVFGFVEVAILGVQRHLLGVFIWSAGPFAWMTPLGYVILFAPLAGALALLSLIRPRWVPPTVPVFLFTLLGTFGLLSMLRAIHPFSILLVAFGLAAVTSRWIGRRDDSWPRIRPRATLVLSALWVVVFGVDLATGATSRRPPVEAENTGGPNILLIIWDTVRAQNLSLYGYQRETTPFLEQLATLGVVFDRAFATAPWTLPSHATLFTGRDAHQLSTGWLQPLDDAPPTLAEVLRERGYRTAAFTANWGYTDREKGLARGFERYVDHRRTPAQFILSSALGQSIHRWRMAAIPADGLVDFVRRLGFVHPFPGRWIDRRYGPDINREFLTWLRNEPRRPYFAFLNYMDAHEPYYAPPQVRARFDAGDLYRDGYDAAILYLDRSIERLMEELDSMDEFDRTLVVITSDHGELLGEHDLLFHGHSLYLPLLRVPLVIVNPGLVPAGIRVSEPVSLRDLPSTLLDLADSGEGALPGRSLTPLWSGKPSEGPSSVLAEVQKAINAPAHHPASRGDMRSLITDRYHYIVNDDGVVELYDYQADPLELNSLTEGSDVDSLLQALERTLQAARAGNG